VTILKNKRLIAVLALAGLAAAYWFLVLGPKRAEVVKLDADIAAKQTELSSAKATLATYRKARDGYAGNYSTVVRLGKAVPGQDDTRSLLVQLDAAASTSGIDFRSMAVGANAGPAPAPAAGTAGGPVVPGAMVGTAGFSVMPLTFSFRGNFFNMSKFFSRLERFVTVDNSKINVTGRLLRVESVTLKPDTLGFPNLRAEIGASSYLTPDAQGLTAGATAAGPAGGTTAPTPAPAGETTPATTTATVTGVTP
jgi:Tfp pilus assembly protein PilO